MSIHKLVCKDEEKKTKIKTTNVYFDIKNWLPESGKKGQEIKSRAEKHLFNDEAVLPILDFKIPLKRKNT